MKTIGILPINLFGFDCEVIDQIAAAVEDEPYYNPPDTTARSDLVSQTENTILHKSYPVLEDYLQRCNDEMWNHVKRDDDTETKLVTTQCWMNKAEKGMHHTHHTHPNSVVSGILYLSTTDTPTRFTIPNLYTSGFIQVYPKEQHHDTFVNQSVRGHTVLFPSKLIHMVPYHNEDEIRQTISWNTFLEGSIKAGIGTLRVGIK